MVSEKCWSTGVIYNKQEFFNLFWGNLAKKIKIDCLGWHLVSRLIGICWIWWWCSLFCSGTKHPFVPNLVEVVKNVSLRWNLVLRLIQICIFQWQYSFFLFCQKYTFLVKLVWKIKIAFFYHGPWCAQNETGIRKVDLRWL